MHKSRLGVPLFGLAVCLAAANVAQAQIDVFTRSTWTAGAGSHNWQDNSNWDTDFPNDTDDMDGIYPVADVFGAYGSNLTINVGTSKVTVAGITLGGTTSAITTEISAGAGGMLAFRNDDDRTLDSMTVGDSDFDSDGDVDGADFLNWARGFGTVNTTPDYDKEIGDADRSFDTDDLDLGIYQTQFGFGTGRFAEGRPFLWSTGNASGTNLITSPIFLDNDRLEIDAEDVPLTIDTGADITSDSLNGTAALQLNAGTVTINSDIIVSDSDSDPMTDILDLQITKAGGTLILNGVIKPSDTMNQGEIDIDGDGRIELYGANEFHDNYRISGGEVLLGNNFALGVDPLDNNNTSRITTNNAVYYSDDDARSIPNNFLLQGDFAFAGDHDLTLTGLITQTNNDGIENDLDSGKQLNVTGTVAIWGDDDTDPDREFDFGGTGKTVVTGEIISWDPQVIIDNPTALPPDYAGLRKTGTGVLVIDVDASDNNHSGDTIIESGNVHYADNDSLNTGAGKIKSYGGAVGVDTGVANNATFMAQIDPISFGGLMAAASESAATFDFTTTLANAANMTLAAPEGGMTFTGTIIPANSTYGLGGGEGTLTLPNATLTGANDVQVRNGGTVQLLGDNTYTGATIVIGVGNPQVLEIDDIANGGVASSIGASTNAAANLEIQNATLKYTGTGDTTDRLFTISTAGGTIDSSGTGALVFSNTGTIVMKDAVDVDGDLDDFTAGNPPNVIYNVTGYTFDIVEGMTISDPDPDFVFGAPNSCGTGNLDPCIPADTTVTGVSIDRTQIGISADYPFIQKLNTRLTFGPTDRTFTLAGDNTDDNEIAGVIGDSADGGVVNIEKNGVGKWILSGSNTYTGSTTVNEGILSITSAFLDDASTVSITTGGTLELDFIGSDTIAELIIDGISQDPGTYDSSDFPGLISGSGSLTVPVLAAALAAVPEPSSLLLISMACVSLAGRRKLSR